MTVSCYDAQGGPGCAGSICNNTIEVFLDGVQCPSDQFVGGGDISLIYSGIRPVYQAGDSGCGVLYYCQAEVSCVQGTMSFWVTPGFNFGFLATEETTLATYPSDTANEAKWHIDPNPFAGGNPTPSRCPNKQVGGWLRLQ